MALLFYLSIFLLGLVVGSFLNVVILRLNSGQVLRLGSGQVLRLGSGQVLRLGSGQVCRLETGGAPRRSSGQGLGGRSHCPHCGQVLRWYDLVPVLSFLILRTRCRYCRQKISWQYPAVEMATGILFVSVIFWILGFEDLFVIWNLSFGILITISYWLFAISCLIVIFVYDLRHYLIPDKIIYPAITAVFLFRLFEILNFGHWPFVFAQGKNLFGIWDLGFGIWEPLFSYLLSAIGASAFFLAIVLITRGKGMGWGDVKLAFLMGLVLGWPNILVALFLAFLSGALVGLAFVANGHKTMKSQIPFGPFLVFGTLIALFFGPSIINWYFTL